MAKQWAGSVFSILIASNLAFADTDNTPEWSHQTFLGDWGGARSALYTKGVEVELTHKSDILANVSGGIKRGLAWMGSTEVGVDINLEKSMGWNSASAYFRYHSQLGSKFNRNYVGSFTGVDNIETTANTAQFNNIWLQQNFSGDKLSVLAGLYAIDSEFYVTDTSSVFILPPYGMASDLAQSGRNGPPIFPVGALALRLKYLSTGKNYYLQYALADAVPGDPANPSGTHIKLGNGDGTLSVVEFGYTPQWNEELSLQIEGNEYGELFNKTAFGYWRYSARFTDLDPSSSFQYLSQGYYFLSEHTLNVDKDDPAQVMSGFFRLGVASAEIHQSDWTESLGLRFHGMLANHRDDIAGIALTVSHSSDKYRFISNAEMAQTDLEVTYRAKLNPWLVVQPSLQYISNPNMDPLLGNAWVVVTRFEVAL